MKKVLISLAVTFVLIIGALFALPYLFKDDIIAKIKEAANDNLTATLEFKDVDISLFRHFPQLAVGLEGLEITGQGPFDGVKLVQCEQLDVTLDLWEAIFGENVVIQGLFFEKPDIRVYVLRDGTANYDITKPEPPGTVATTSSSDSKIKLERYAITNGKVLYDDRSLDMRLELSGLNHSGSGEFTADIFDLVMETTADALSVDYGGMGYLSKAKADWKSTLNMDLIKSKYTFKENDLKINALQVLLDGWVELPNDDDILMDLKFSTPTNTFKSFLSIIPGAYTKDFDGVQANGTIQFDGFARGKYNETTYPAFTLNLKVGKADFKYPSLPLGVSNINVYMSVKSPSQSLNAMTVNIPKFSLRIGSNPLEGYFNLKTPVSDPTVDTKIKGTLNLTELSKAFPMEGVQELSGIIKADVMMKAAMSQIDRGDYASVDMSGDFDITNMNYRSEGSPPVKIIRLNTSLSPEKVDIRTFDARLGRSDLRASGKIDNVLAYFSTTKTMKGALNFTSSNFDANEWMTEEPADGSKVPTDVPPSGESEEVFDRWDFAVDGKINRLAYEDYKLTDVAMKGHFTPNKMDIENFGLKLGASDLNGNGQILNAWNYLFDNQTVLGVINLSSNYFDLNQFMTDDAPATAAAPAEKPVEEIIPVPENMDMTINADFKNVRYTDLMLKNLDGQVTVKNSVASLNDCTAEVIGGLVAWNGSYDTRNLAKPLFNMDLALQNMGFKEAYTNFASVKSLAPIAQLIDGKFNTTLSMSGVLGKDMMPDLTTLSAAGFIETLNAIINNFKPLNDIGSKLNVDYLKQLELKNTRNWFEIKNGMVTVKPFNVQMRDVAMQISGSHGLNSDMNYQFLTKTPRKALGSAANSGLDFLAKEAAKYKVNIAQGEYINVRFDVTGTMKNPKVAFKVLGSDGQSTIQDQATATIDQTVEKAKDSLTNLGQAELDKAKGKAQAEIDKYTDSLKREAERQAKAAADKAAKQVSEEAGKVLGKELGDKVGGQVGDEVGKKAGEVINDPKVQKTTEDVKKKLDEWDPFKKKKKN